MTQRLPLPGGDNGTWGSILNGFLEVSHNADGTLIPSAIVAAGALSTATKLSGLADTTNASSAANGQVLAYNTTSNNWVPSTVTDTVVNNATYSTPGLVQLTGDLGNGTSGTATSPQVTSTHLSSPLPLNQGGTGSITQNFVDLTANQTIAGIKTFSSTITGSISGNAATATTASTVTTNANLTGDVTSTGNATTLTASTNVESIISANTTVAGALQKANNLSDVSDAGYSRASLHVPMLGSCQAVVSSNVSLSAPGAGPFDGYTPTNGDQLLLTAQTTASQNGPWVWNGTSSAMARPTDYASGTSVKGRTIQINAGSTNGGSLWVMTTSSSVTVDATATAWALAKAGATAGSYVSLTATSPQTMAGTLIGSLQDEGGQMFNVKAYGALGNFKTVTDGAITSGLQALTSSQAVFTNSDVGKGITVTGAGASGVNLVTTISAYVSSTQVTVSAAAGTTVTGATTFYGTDDSTAIVAAATAAHAAGGEVVYFPAGNYRIATAISTQIGNHFLGNGASSILTFDNGALNPKTDSTIDGFYITSTSNQASGTNNGALHFAQGNTRITIKNCRYNINANGRPIFLDTNSWSLIENVSFTATLYTGVYLIFCFTETNLTIRGAMVNGVTTSSSSVNIGAIEINTCTDVTLEGCMITGCITGTAVGGGGISLSNSTRVAVVNCFAYNNTGIDGLGVVAGCVDVSVTGGSYSYNAANASATNGDGIDAYGVVGLKVNGVGMVGNGQNGIEIYQLPGGGSTGTQTVSVTGCELSGNGILGVQIVGVLDVIINGNQIHNNAAVGMNVVSYSAVNTTNLIITNNNIYNNQGTVGGFSSAGIYLAGATNNFVVANNNIYDDQGTPTQIYGINIQNTVNTGIIADNVFHGNISGAISNATSSAETPNAVVTRGNVGYNPRGTLGPPAIPSSTTALNNPYGVDCMVYVIGGTVTVIAVSGTTTGMTSGPIWVPANASITLTYSAAPTWKWIGS